mmetsp:Transcript_47598/g.75292  ORF Transcript_47598/g.75292 Transcript_47598/m.75292 type:complete len:219 (+) Transcript_47598:280-936(+)
MEISRLEVSQLLHVNEAVFVAIHIFEWTRSIFLFSPLLRTDLAITVFVFLPHLLFSMNAEHLWMGVWMHQVDELFLVELAITIDICCVELFFFVSNGFRFFVFFGALMYFSGLAHVLLEAKSAIFRGFDFVEDLLDLLLGHHFLCMVMKVQDLLHRHFPIFIAIQMAMQIVHMLFCDIMALIFIVRQRSAFFFITLISIVIRWERIFLGSHIFLTLRI